MNEHTDTNERLSTGAQMRAITISREYGSGGGEIARRLAASLGWQLVDHEVVVRVARELGVSEAEVEAFDEHSAGLVSHLIASMRSVDPALLVNIPDEARVESEETYHDALQRVVQAAAREGHVVIVGRGGQMALGDQRAVLHIRIIAPLDKRVVYVMQREGLGQEDARARIQLKDRDRQRYLHAQYRQSSDNPHLYDLVINTGVLDMDSAVALILLALERKALKLQVPETELGPGAGSQRYTGRPGDFRPPASMS